VQLGRRPARVFCLGVGTCCALLPVVCHPAVSRAEDSPLPHVESGRDASPATPPPAARARDPGSKAAAARLATLDRRLGEVDSLLAGAYFETALSLADSTRGLLEAGAGSPAQASRRARLEVMAAEAEVALGRPTRARRSLERALSANPDIELDEALTSPRLLELLPAARRRVGLAGRRP
jgi:hypothetical protein